MSETPTLPRYSGLLLGTTACELDLVAHERKNMRPGPTQVTGLAACD